MRNQGHLNPKIERPAIAQITLGVGVRAIGTWRNTFAGKVDGQQGMIGGKLQPEVTPIGCSFRCCGHIILGWLDFRQTGISILGSPILFIVHGFLRVIVWSVIRALTPSWEILVLMGGGLLWCYRRGWSFPGVAPLALWWRRRRLLH